MIVPLRYPKKQSTLLGMLLSLTFLFIAAQLSLFFVHYKVSELIDTLANSAISQDLMHPLILFPLIYFMMLHILSYLLFVLFIWFIAVSCGDFFRLTQSAIYWVGILFWLCGCFFILCLNNYFFSHSFFADLLRDYPLLQNKNFLNVIALFFAATTTLAYIELLRNKKHWILGCLFLILGSITIAIDIYEHQFSFAKMNTKHEKPNIIIIGLDSLRPDFTSYGGNKVKTPHIDHFLQTGSAFINAYTPLARTFPAWMSILTGKYPKHHFARINLADPLPVMKNDSLVKHLKANGYETVFGTDEMRFSDITKQYGFDRIIGTKSGAVEFLLAGLSDFPLTNLLIKLPVGRFLLPYSYGNRAADVTYEPEHFLQLIKHSLAGRSDKPLFLAVHLCLAHWPFTWANDRQSAEMSALLRYQKSVEAVDEQFGKLMQILQAAGLLQHSLVVLLSDHGLTLGLPHDRLLTLENYRGSKSKLNRVTRFKLGNAPEFSLDFKNDYSLGTSYGQGTDVLSLRQNQILLGFKGFGLPVPARRISESSSLLDIAPTILDMLHLSSLPRIDGVSLKNNFGSEHANTFARQPFFIESGDTIGEIESDAIDVQAVIKAKIKAYQLNGKSGLLSLNPAFFQSMLKSKQRAILYKDWMLAAYPAKKQLKLVKDSSGQKVLIKPQEVAPYFVLINVKTGLWTLDFDSSLTKKAPFKELVKRLQFFYGNEIGSYPFLR